MRGYLLVVMMLTCAALAGCAETRQAVGLSAEPAGAPPLPQARILMREVDETGNPHSTPLKGRDGTPLLLKEPPLVTTADVASVALGMDATGQPVLNVQMTDAAAPRILAATQARIGRRVAFSVGERVLTVATVAGPFGKAMQVAGLEDAGDAQRMYTEITGQTR